ncbi:MAG: hypothetical protein K2K96_10945 [Lachnospiraceae bacterium]|nr:hypothetical protein [Lachnospiraceae bacterium]
MEIRRKRLDNKGAALVTILIAVTFMTIMASSLMYMAYMNFLTKSMRYSATDNFYTDEFALDELSTTLQETAARQPKIDDARREILKAVGDNNGHPRAYSPTAVAGLMELAGQEASISVNCALADETGALTEDSLIVDDEYIKLVGVMITATTPEGYQSTITSDVTIYFPSTIPGSMDINDFSVITDSPLVFNNGGARYFSGNVFAQQTDSSSNAPALLVDHNTVVGLLSQQVMIVGDVKVTGNSTLHVTGNMTVYGKIEVDAGSALICSGKILHSGPITGSGTLKGISDREKDPMDVPISDELVSRSDGLVDSLFLDVWVRNNGGDYKTFDIGLYDRNWDQTLRFETGNPADPRCFIFSASTTINVDRGSEYENALILVEAGNSSYPTELSLAVHDGVMAQTTVMSTGPVVYHYEQGTSYMSKMSDEAFEFAKNYLFYRTGGQIDVRDTPDGGDYRINIGSGSNDISFATGRVEDIPGGVNTFTRGGDGREFMYGDDGKNYLPIYQFLDENSSDIISKIFAAPTGTSDPKNSTIIYERWSKD